jgi:hypothetical protein
MNKLALSFIGVILIGEWGLEPRRRAVYERLRNRN